MTFRGLRYMSSPCSQPTTLTPLASSTTARSNRSFVASHSLSPPFPLFFFFLSAMARLELPASLLLLTPACNDRTPAGADEASESLAFANVDTFEAVHTSSGDLKDVRYSIDVSELLHEGNTEVYRGTLSVDGRRHRNANVVCKLARGKSSVETLHREADLYRGTLAPLQGRYIPTYVGLFGREAEGGETACLVLTYEGVVMQQSLYTSTIDFRCVLNSISHLIVPARTPGFPLPGRRP